MKMPKSEARPVHMPPLTDAELEARAIADLERMQRARDAKRSGYKPKCRGKGGARG